MLTRCAALLLALALLLGATSAAPVGAQNVPAGAHVAGRALDAATGLPLAGANITVPGTGLHAVSDRDGVFQLNGLPPGTYTLRVAREGYQPAVSDPLALVAGSSANVTVALQATPVPGEAQIVGRTATTVGAALQKSSTISRTIDTENLAATGVNRAGDALRELPGVNNGINGNTASLGDDINLSLRGIGTLETTATLDGHPIAYGAPGGYNVQLSPLAPFRNITVTYGSGSNLYGESAIGGTVDFETLVPTPDDHVTVQQGYGTFDRLATSAQATGTTGRFGYALAYSVAGLDGPLHHDPIYQPGAAYDASATDPSVRNLAVYDDDGSAISRSQLFKLRYAASPASTLTFTTVAMQYYENKTGNGDGDYLDYTPALAFGNQLLANYSPAKYSTLSPCPAGEFIATNANGHVNGTGPNGQADGGSACETPQQYASGVSGYQGAGPAFETFDLNDEDLSYEVGRDARNFRLDAYCDRYLNTVNRAAQLPFKAVPGDVGKIRDNNVVETGVDGMETFIAPDNELAFGFTSLNVAYDLITTGATGSSVGAPYLNESGFVLDETYHAVNSPLTAFVDARAIHASETNSSSIDPRASLVDALTPHDVLRFSAGATTTEPAGNQLGQPFTPSSLGGAGGGATITCGGLNSIGNVPSTALLPERGVDEELAYGHSFGGDSQTQLALYDVNVYNKLYSALVPISQTGTFFIPATVLSSAEQAIGAKCGATDVDALIGLTGTFNIGQLQARGFTLSGRQRVARRTFIDYDWTLDSSALISAPVTLLQANPSYILGSQLPHVPLHTISAALDQRLGVTELRYTYYGVSANNSKNLPPYDYSNLQYRVPLPHGSITLAVSNLFNQDAFSQGLQYEGVPLALNQYASASAYAPYTGAAATEAFGLPFRMLYVDYTLHL